MAEHYVVAFNGQLAEGKSLDVVKQGVAQLFKVDVVKVEHLFKGQWTPIKKGIDQLTAEKYQRALAKMGAICQVVSAAQFAELKAPPAAVVEHSPAADEKVATSPSEKPPFEYTTSTDSTETELERSVVKEAPTGLGELEGIAVEASWDHLEEPDDTPPPQVDLSGVNLAERGADLVEHQDLPDLEVDTSELSLDALGVDMAEHQEVPELLVDTSGMVLDEPGVIIVEHKPVEKPDIDTSKISLE